MEVRECTAGRWRRWEEEGEGEEEEGVVVEVCVCVCVLQGDGGGGRRRRRMKWGEEGHSGKESNWNKQEMKKSADVSLYRVGKVGCVRAGNAKRLTTAIKTSSSTSPIQELEHTDTPR